MVAPRNARDVENRRRGVVLNRNRAFQRRISVPQAARNAGTFAPGDLQRAARVSTPAPSARSARTAGPAGNFRRAATPSPVSSRRPQTSQRGGVLSAARRAANRLADNVRNRRRRRRG